MYMHISIMHTYMYILIMLVLRNKKYQFECISFVFINFLLYLCINKYETDRHKLRLITRKKKREKQHRTRRINSVTFVSASISTAP